MRSAPGCSGGCCAGWTFRSPGSERSSLRACVPVAVESVAWISELKNTLSLPLLLLAMIAYLEFDGRWSASTSMRLPPEQPSKRIVAPYFLPRYFPLPPSAMLSKTSAVMFPGVLLLYAWWRRGRIARRDVAASLPPVLPRCAAPGPRHLVVPANAGHWALARRDGRRWGTTGGRRPQPRLLPGQMRLARRTDPDLSALARPPALRAPVLAVARPRRRHRPGVDGEKILKGKHALFGLGVFAPHGRPDPRLRPDLLLPLRPGRGSLRLSLARRLGGVGGRRGWRGEGGAARRLAPVADGRTGRGLRRAGGTEPRARPDLSQRNRTLDLHAAAQSRRLDRPLRPGEPSAECRPPGGSHR